MHDSQPVTFVDAQAFVLRFAGQLGKERGCVFFDFAAKPFAVGIDCLRKQSFHLLAQFFPGTLDVQIGVGKLRDLDFDLANVLVDGSKRRVLVFQPLVHP
jgi:hypothetical protein